MSPINFVAIIVASIAAFVVGFLMHGPVAGKLWMKLANIVPTGKEKFKDMVPQMLWNLLANVFTAFIVSIVLFLVAVVSMGSRTFAIIFTTLVLWIFVVAGSSMDVIWMGKSKKLWMFECLCSLLTLLATSVVIAYL